MSENLNLQPARVFIDRPEKGVYECFLDPTDRWNGWQVPYFTQEQGKKLAAGYPNINPDEEMRYDEATDRFDVIDKLDGDIIESAEGLFINGQKFYQIGNGWIWDMAEDD